MPTFYLLLDYVINHWHYPKLKGTALMQNILKQAASLVFISNFL